MGLFGNLFGKKKELPQLDPSSPAATQLKNLKGSLDPFVAKIHDTMEMVPTDKTVFVYLGKPPSMFGLVWFDNGQEVNFKTYTASKGLKQKQIQSIYGRLGEAYAEFENSPRFETEISGKKVIVIPSDPLGEKIHKIVHEID